MAIFKRNRKELYGILLWLGVTASLMGLFAPSVDAFALSEAAWTDEVWQEHCRTVRTTFNPDQPLNTNMLTITANDPRFVDFLYWVWSNKIIEHQVEQLGGTGWAGPMGRGDFPLGAGIPLGNAYTYVVRSCHSPCCRRAPLARQHVQRLF